MNAKNLTWNQIKELADMAVKGGCDFSLDISKDGETSIRIDKHDVQWYQPYYTYTTTTNPAVINIDKNVPNPPWTVTCKSDTCKSNPDGSVTYATSGYVDVN